MRNEFQKVDERTSFYVLWMGEDSASLYDKSAEESISEKMKDER